MSKKRTYTKELLEKAARQTTSIRGIMDILGLSYAGGTHSFLSKRLKEYEIDITHFKKANEGKPAKNKKTWKEILIKRNDGYRQHSYVLRRSLIEAGKEYKCECCGLSKFWNNKPLMLQVNHKSRNWLDDRLENLEFICPNCHSQTFGWCGSKGLAEIMTTAVLAKEHRKRNKNGKYNN